MGAVVAVGFCLPSGLRRFGEVQAGVLYRSGQPTAAGWQALVRWYRIRTVVDLRAHDPSASWSLLQDQVCRENGLRLVHLPMTQRDVIDEEMLRRFLSIVCDPRNWPVLVHCEHGSARTGVMVGAYRILVDGWTYDETLAEALRYRFRPHANPHYDAFLRRLAWRRDQAVGSLAAGR